MANTDTEQFLLERLLAFDPTTDTNPGSPAYLHVINPTLARLGADPFSTDIRSFILSRLAREYPDLDADGAGNPIADVLVGPAQLLLDPIRREITQVKLTQSLKNPDLLTGSEADSILANMYEPRQSGDVASGTVRVYYNSKRVVQVDTTVQAVSLAGLVYFASEVKTVTADEMGLNIEGGQYYIDLEFDAVTEGDEYNIAAGQISAVFGLPGVVKVANKEAFENGLPRETTANYIARAKTAISERSPNTDDGVANKLSVFSDLRAVRTIGYGDLEMVRDIIKGTVTFDPTLLGLGPIVLTGGGTGAGAAVLFSWDPAEPDLDTVGAGYPTPRTNRFIDLTQDLSVLNAGDAINIGGIDHGVVEPITSNEVQLDDFTIEAMGAASGFTTQLAPTAGGASLLFTESLEDAAVDFLAEGVSAGDYIRLHGTWVPGITPPTGGELAAGPGNTLRGYFKVLAVQQHKVYFAPFLQSEVLKVGDAASNSGVDSGSPGANDITLDPAAVDTFTTGVALQPGDFITLYTAVGPAVATQEFEIVSVLAGGLQLTLDGPPTLHATGTWDVAWTARRGVPQGGVAREDLVLAGTSGINWAAIRFRGDIDPDTYTAWLSPTAAALSWTARSRLTLADVNGQAALTISDIPAAVTFPETLEGTISVGAGDIVHVGGMTDAYAHQLAPAPTTHDFLDLRDESPLFSGSDLIIVAPSLDITNSTTLAAANVDLGDYPVLVILEGENLGAHRILTVSAGTLRVDTDLVAIPAPGAEFYITNEMNLNLKTPKIHRLQDGTALSTVLHSSIVQDTTVDFSTLGVEVGDTVEIKKGQDKGKYLVVAIPAVTQLQIDADMIASATAVNYDVYKAIPTLDFPLRRITKVALLDGAGTPSGLNVPPADPVDVRSSQLVNVVNGVKRTGTDLQLTGTVGGRVDSGVDLVRDFGVASGDILEITAGDQVGVYTIYNVVGNVLLIQFPPGQNESFGTVTVTVSYDTLVGGPFQAGDVLTPGGGGPPTYGVVLTDTPGAPGEGVLTVAWSYHLDIGNNASLEGSISGATALTNAISSATPVSYRIGSPSIGTLRCYFLEPTWFEVLARDYNASLAPPTLFTTADNKEYVPDYNVSSTIFTDTTETAEGYACPNLTAVTGAGAGFIEGEAVTWNGGADVGTIIDIVSGVIRICVADGETPPIAGDVLTGVSSLTVSPALATATTTASAFVALGVDFEKVGVSVGSAVNLVTKAMIGTVDLSAAINLSGVKFGLIIDGGVESILTFSGTNPISLDIAGDPGGIVQQITAFFPDVVAAAYTDPDGNALVTLHSAKTITIGTQALANTLLGFNPPTSNALENSTAFLVEAFGPDEDMLVLGDLDLSGGPIALGTLADESTVKYTIELLGVQRVGAKEMALNTENGLYYVDVEVRSVLPGDTYNLAEDTVLTVANHRSFGYRLVSKNDALTFSTIEDVDLEITPMVDDPLIDTSLEALVTVAASDIRIYYELGGTISSAQALLLRDGDRVVCNNPLARFMLPSFVRLAVSYFGGSLAAVVLEDLVELIDGTQSGEILEINDINYIFTKRGATRVIGPIELVAIRHNVDRTVTTIRSKDGLSVGRTSKLIADRDNITLTRG